MATASLLNVASPFVYLINGSDNLVYTFGLPAPLLAGNTHYYLKRTDSTNGTVTVLPNGATIEGQTSINLPAATTYHVYCDGTSYYILGKL